MFLMLLLKKNVHLIKTQKHFLVFTLHPMQYFTFTQLYRTEINVWKNNLCTAQNASKVRQFQCRVYLEMS